MGDPALTAFFGGECGAAAAGLAALSGTSTIQDGDDHDFEFQTRSGVRYQVDVRVGEGSRGTVPCTGNVYDSDHGAGACDREISAGQNSCTVDFCATCRYAHDCDLSCGFLCPEDGATSTSFYILPPGATDDSQAVASQITLAADKGLSFTAAATGTFIARVGAYAGSSPVEVTANAVGTALASSAHSGCRRTVYRTRSPSAATSTTAPSATTARQRSMATAPGSICCWKTSRQGRRTRS